MLSRFFIENEFQHDGLTKLIVTKDMSERKNKMIELGEAFIALPRRHGNIGGNCRGNVRGVFETSGGTLHSLQPEWLLHDDLKALLNHMIEKRIIF